MNYRRIREGIHANNRQGKYQGKKFVQAAQICGKIHTRELYAKRGPSKTAAACEALKERAS
jgi:hypothetical protein